jgi:hypothetical protein
MSPALIADLSWKLCHRTPASYVTGFYMFIVGLCATTVYQNLISMHAQTTREFTIVEKEMKAIVEALDSLACRHVVLRSFAMALEARRYRVRGRLEKATTMATALSPSKLPDCSCPLGLAYLLMESALCKLKLLQSSPAPATTGEASSRTESTKQIINDAKASLKLFAPFDADTEVAELDACMAAASELLDPQDRSQVSELLNTPNTREAHLRGGAARAYWLELSKVDAEADEEQNDDT